MSRPSFDVLMEPWIPVTHLDGSLAEMGILGCLERASALREIRDPSPIVEFGLYRLLVAFVLDAMILDGCRPEEPSDLRDLIDQGAFFPGLFDRYVEVCGDVFDLFHPERPFLQTVMDSEKAKPLAGLFPAMPSGTNVTHWLHVPEDDWVVDAREAARLLTTIAPFMTAGGAGLSPSINGAPGVYVLPVGRSLYETLILNMPLRQEQDRGDGAVAWRSCVSPGRERSQATTVESLTWRPRRIQLVATGDASDWQVREMKFAKGDSTRLSWIDCSLAYRYEGNKVTPIRMRENRPLWRDAGPLLLVNDIHGGRGDKRVCFKRPDVVDQAFMVDIDGLPQAIHVYAMRTDLKMKIFEWTKGSWVVPPALGRSTRLGGLVEYELERAEKAGRCLWSSVKSLYPREGAGNKNALKSVSNRCERAYWMALEKEFVSLLDSFAALDPDAPDDPSLIDATAKPWRETISSLVLEQFERAAKDMDTDGEALERLVKARARLQGSLRKVLS
ncbi:MAG: type I-E CRISPR-associated protein Cse1/CasA [Thermoleophilia bacterium]|jgi:CRISPR system Cascade subunit CasA